MNDAAAWQFARDELQADRRVLLVVVVDHRGSSPGRATFKLVVAGDGRSVGTIGGGIMEYTITQRARDWLASGERVVECETLYHNKETTRPQSGMICAGRQTNVYMVLTPDDRETVTQILTCYATRTAAFLQLTPSGLQLARALQSPSPLAGEGRGEGDRRLACHPEERSEGSPGSGEILRFAQDDRPNGDQDDKTNRRDDRQDWSYTERLGVRDCICIIGGGHVGLALSRQMRLLDFEIRVYDDRPEVHTLHANDSADAIIITPYEQLAQHVPDGDHVYVAIVTAGYPTDLVATRALLGKRFRYVGLMGSRAKCAKLLSVLASEGVPREAFQHLHAPIGLLPHSHTVEEIAVSIAAQILQVRRR